MTRAAWILLLAATVAGAQELKLRQKLAPGFAVSAYRVVDLHGNGRDDLLLVGRQGEVRTWTVAEGKFAPQPQGELVLPDPAHTLLAQADFLQQGRPPQLLVLDRSGATLHPVGADGTYTTDAVPLARRARFRLRTGGPHFADIVQDVNGDGRPDLVVPGREQTQVWITQNGEAPRLRKAAQIATDIWRSEGRAAENLSDRLWSRFTLPQLRTRDVNGDGRRDLLVESGTLRAFHLQEADGTLPAQPDVTVDLRIFRDTTPAAKIRPGRILAGGDSQRYQTRDLDDDGIPDYVIAHRRKVWVFHGNRERPQFTEPTTILKVSDDVTALMLLHFNGDKYPDMLILKVHVPTIGTLIVGAMRSFVVEIDALGYASRKGRTFERTPTWKSRITVRVPALFKIIKNPGALLARFEGVGRKFRLSHEADLDGDGAKETIMAAEDRTRIEVWQGDRTPEAERPDYDAVIRRVLFEEADTRWDIDRILQFLSGLAEQRARRLTGGRAPDMSFALRDAGAYEYRDLVVGDFEGDQRDEIVVHYERRKSPGTVFDVVGR
ncbi:MAG: FG-GAP repeat domain-containing protein [Planctomycetota bacterium]